MEMLTLGFADRLREALVADRDATFVFLGNFEVEENWAQPYGRLPGFAVKSASAVVNRMEEFGLFLASANDHVLLKDRVDRGFARYLADRGFDAPNLLYVDRNRPERTVTQDALDSPGLLGALRRLAERNAYLLPLGTGDLEERLSAKTGLPLAVPSAAVFRRVNSKIYSRRLTERLGLRSTPGVGVSSIDDLRGLNGSLLAALDRRGRIVVKEALGVSGKGIVVIDARRRLEQLVAMLERRALRTSDGRLDLVVEHWIEDKACDLNYQFVIARDGTVTFDFVKEALTEGGVHKGHLMPSRLTPAQVDYLRECAGEIGAQLHADGYRGVVGVDAILDASGQLYPVLEINARFNMSTYQTDVAERYIGPGKVALACHWPLRLRQRLAFDDLAARLRELLFDAERGTGLLVNNFAAVNAALTPAGEFDGRLYGLLIAESRAALTRLDEAVTHRLRDLQEARQR
jgi:predicted ATP-grasp superfamily ATP-dependent carboligase